MSYKPENIIPDFDRFMETIVSKLPQAEHIKEEDAKIWYEATKLIEPDRFHWHCDRLKGIGGSDIGELVAAQMGEYNAFKTPYDIINEKLMRKTIEPATVHTRFGTLMEPVSKAIFQDDFHCQSNNELIQQVNNHVSKRHPWMRSNVDDIVGIGGPKADMNVAGVMIIDYKNKAIIPVEPSTPEKCQVHQYNYALEESGFEGPVGRAVVYTDFKAKKVVAKPVDLDPNLLATIFDAGDKAWEHVLTDTKPAFKVSTKSDLVFSDKSKEKLDIIEQQIAKVKVISDAATSKLGELKKSFEKEIKEQAKGMLLKGQNVPLQILSTTVRQKLIVPEFENLVESQQLDLKDFQKPGTKMDEERMTEALVLSGMEPADFIMPVFDIPKICKFCEEKGFQAPIEESISATLKACKKNKYTKEDLEEIKGQGAELVDSIKNDVSLTPGRNQILSPR